LNSLDKTHPVDKHVHTQVVGFSSNYQVSQTAWYKFPYVIIYAVYYFLFTIISLIGLFLVLMAANVALLFRKKEKGQVDLSPVTF